MEIQFSFENLIKDIVKKENEALYQRILQLMSSKETFGRDLKPMTFIEACAYISCSKSYLYKMTSQNLIPHSKRGKKLYFIKAQLDKWLVENKVRTIDEIKHDVGNQLTGRRQA
jgi:excisionase family DNA binding protein